MELYTITAFGMCDNFPSCTTITFTEKYLEPILNISNFSYIVQCDQKVLPTKILKFY